MSSITHSPSQITTQSKFLIAFAESDPNSMSISTSSAFRISLPWPIGIESRVNGDVLNGEGEYYDFVAGVLFRDLGRQLTVVDAENTTLALYRETMPMTNVETEGVGTPQSVWVRVWAAEGSGVRVARLG
jgi:hypothetical protein